MNDINKAEPPEPPPGPRQARRAKQYAKLHYTLMVVDFIYFTAFLAAFLVSGRSTALKNAVSSTNEPTVTAQALYFIFFVVLTALALLPLNFYESYLVERRFDLSTQSALAWLGDEFKTTVLSAVIFTPAGLTAYYLLSEAGSYWWIYGALLWTGFSFVLAYLAPVVIMPLFNKFGPLDSAELRDDILALAKKAGVGVSGVLKTDMSRRTKKANAFFAGAGNTRRIVLGDTLVDNYTHDEILTVVGHEMGHWKLGHLTKNTAVGIIGAIAGFYAADRILRLLFRPLGLTGIDDIAGLPLILLTFMFLGLIGMPFLNALSRHFERQADDFELQLVNKPEATISTFEKLGEQNLADPDPNPLIELVLFSHPSIKNRIAAAHRYEAGQGGDR